MSAKKTEQSYDAIDEWEEREPNVAYVLVDGELVEVPTPARAGQPQGEVTDATQPPAQDHDVHDGRRPEVGRRRRR
jgi:hypothetical protein